MTTQTATISDFLLARIAERRKAAENYDTFVQASARPPARGLFKWLEGDPAAKRRDRRLPKPAHLLAECDAIEAIVETYQGTRDAFDALDARVTAGKLTGTNAFVQLAVSGALIEAYADILRTLAAVYADHEDFQEEWRL